MLNVEIRLPGTGQHYDFALDETAPVAAVARAVAEAAGFSDCRIVDDLAGRPRVLVARR